MTEQEGAPEHATEPASQAALVLRPGAAWVLVPRYPDVQGIPVWFVRLEDARDALARVQLHTWYLCRMEAAAGPKAHLLPIGSAGQL